jgi:hypothetical protein
VTRSNTKGHSTSPRRVAIRSTRTWLRSSTNAQGLKLICVSRRPLRNQRVHSDDYFLRHTSVSISADLSKTHVSEGRVPQKYSGHCGHADFYGALSSTNTHFRQRCEGDYADPITERHHLNSIKRGDMKAFKDAQRWIEDPNNNSNVRVECDGCRTLLPQADVLAEELIPCPGGVDKAQDLKKKQSGPKHSNRYLSISGRGSGCLDNHYFFRLCTHTQLNAHTQKHTHNTQTEHTHTQHTHKQIHSTHTTRTLSLSQHTHTLTLA